jgi:hypothetical protein
MDHGPQPADLHSWWCAAAHEIYPENDDGRRTTDGEQFSSIVAPRSGMLNYPENTDERPTTNDQKPVLS